MADAYGATRKTSSTKDIKPRLAGANQSVADNMAYYRYGDSDVAPPKEVSTNGTKMAVKN